MSDSAHSNGHAAHLGTAATAEASGHGAAPAEDRKPFKPQYPLTSWADTRQNVACIAFILGCVFTFAVSNGIKLFSDSETLLSVQDLSTKERFWNTLTGPRFGIYIALLVVFHMSEFLTTAIYNPSKASVRSFLLDDRNHNAAHVFALLELFLEEMYLDPKWLAFKHSFYLTSIGLTIAIAAQYLRSLAMITAASNFSHLIQYTKAPEHSLVRTGIYGWSRHPSYFAFFYWAIASQVFIGNPVSFLVFSVILYRFFSSRIKIEEWYLIKFFGQDYVKFKEEVPTRIPFIR